MFVLIIPEWVFIVLAALQFIVIVLKIVEFYLYRNKQKEDKLLRETLDRAQRIYGKN